MEIKGLTSHQVYQMQQQGKVNHQKVKPTKSVWDIVRTNVFTFFNLIFIVLFSIVLAVGKYKDGLFMIIIVANTLIGIFQEIRAKRTIDKLSLVTAPYAAVIRDGKKQKISIEELVEGDIVIFSSGDQISADGIVIDGYAEANEALLTGESDVIKKNIGDTVLSGSFISSGSIYCRLTGVGKDSYTAKISNEVKKYKKIKSELLTNLNKIIKVIGFIIVPVGILLFCKEFFVFNENVNVSVSRTVAALIGMIPEGLFLLTSIALAVSVVNLSKAKVLVQEMYSIESLARVNVICVDKTGTITSGEMTVSEIYLFENTDIKNKMCSMLYALNDTNPTSLALKDYFGCKEIEKASKIIPFSSQRKYSGCQLSSGCYVFGAPEFILKESYKLIKDKVEEYACKGKRVILFAKTDGFTDEIPYNPRPIALITIEDKLRNNVKKTFEFFSKNDVQIKVISGDNPATVSAVALRAGIKGAEKYLDLSTLSDDDIEKSAAEYNIFGRVTPHKKRILINALKNAGNTVAMVGDGVNDVLALKDADCSIAMAAGSEAAKRVSHLVLLESDFSSMPDVVYEGRRVINNIERSATLFLVKTIFSLSLALLIIFMPFSYPFQPIQLTLISALTIGAPSFILALEPNRNIVKGNFLKNVLVKALPSGLTIIITLLTLLTVCTCCHMSDHTISTCATILVGFIGFITMFRVCYPFNFIRTIMFTVLAVAFGGAIVLFGRLLLDFVMLNIYQIILLSVLCFIAIPLVDLLSKLLKRIMKI